MAVGTFNGEPMVEMNTTPLIDVLLVLLIMFIITIPIQTHAVKLDLPSATPPQDVRPIRNEIAIATDDAVSWNGRRVSFEQLRANMRAVASAPVPPDVQIRPDRDARFEPVDRVLVEARQSGVTRLGFVGNENYRRF